MEAFKAPKDAVLAEIKLYFFSFNFDDFTSEGKAILAFSDSPQKSFQEELSFSLPIPDVDNRLILVAKHVSFKRELDGVKKIIQNRRFMAAEIVALAYIQDGIFLEYQEEKIEKKLREEAEVGVWVDLV